ncbi:MAG: hypothetical protein L6R42_006229, partial [Xanthoria sp. 1 TBL-2021]
MPVTCECRKSSQSSSGSSSSSSASSKSSFRDLRSKIENLVKRLANMEKELQADREKANQTMSTAVARDDKIEKEVGGLKEAVGGINTRDNKMEKEIVGLKDAVGKINQEVEALRKDVVWVKEQHGRSWDQAARGGEGGGREGRVRVEWERHGSNCLESFCVSFVALTGPSKPETDQLERRDLAWQHTDQCAGWTIDDRVGCQPARPRFSVSIHGQATFSLSSRGYYPLTATLQYHAADPSEIITFNIFGTPLHQHARFLGTYVFYHTDATREAEPADVYPRDFEMADIPLP